MEAKQKNNKTTSMDDVHVWVPLSTLDSFATELYFKTLQVLEFGKAERGHNYQKLFDKLPSGTQKAIRELYKNLLQTKQVEMEMKRMSPEARKLTPFNTCLAHSGEVFEKFRYIYEEPKNLMFYWPNLRISLRLTIVAMCPDWSIG